MKTGDIPNRFRQIGVVQIPMSSWQEIKGRNFRNAAKLAIARLGRRRKDGDRKLICPLFLKGKFPTELICLLYFFLKPIFYMEDNFGNLDIVS